MLALAREDRKKGSSTHIFERRSKMGPNDVGLARVWTRNTDATVSDVTMPSGTSFDVVVDCEAGAAASMSGMPWWIDICVRDLCAADPPIYEATQNGNLGAAPWDTPEFRAVFPIPAQPANLEGHVMEVIATLRIRLADPDVSFGRSDLFIITVP
jgi:hypothetical protein